MLRINPKKFLLLIGSFLTTLAFICSFGKLTFTLGNWSVYVLPYYSIFAGFGLLFLFFGMLYPSKYVAQQAHLIIRFLVVICLSLIVSFVLYHLLLYSYPAMLIQKYDVILVIFFILLWSVTTLKLSVYYRKVKTSPLDLRSGIQ